MRIRPYMSCVDFDTMSQWITDERPHALWCANGFTYPLERESFDNKLEELAVSRGDFPFAATDDNGNIMGFFCCSVNTGTNEAMLKYVIIDSRLRGRGCGSEMIGLAVKYALEIANAEAVQLNVFSVNTRARKCYMKAGFTERSVTENAFGFKDEQWSRCNMIITK